MRIKLSIPFLLSDIAKAMGAVFYKGDEKILIEYITTDTRELRPCDLFIALRGERFNGESFLKTASACGAYTVSTKSESDITVTSSEIALLLFASAYKRKLPLKETVAITGSNGKTTTRELLASLFKGAKLKFHASEHNYNNLIGVSISILTAPKDTEYLILECGMSKKGELRRISNAVCPTVCVITNIGTSHLANLKSRLGIAEAKLEILSGMHASRVIIPEEEPLLTHLSCASRLSVRSANSDYGILQYEQGEKADEYYFFASGKLQKKLNSDLPFCHIKEALGYALSVYCECGISFDKLYAYELPNSLLHTRLISYNDIKILDDSYNCSIESVVYGIKTLEKINAKRHILLLSDTLEVLNPKEYHESIGKVIAIYRPELIFLYGSYAENIKSGALCFGYPEENIRVITQNYDESLVADALTCVLKPHDALLIKGSHSTNACKIAPLITMRK